MNYMNYVFEYRDIDIKIATGRWFSPGTPVSSTNNTDPRDIAEILSKEALNTINLDIKQFYIVTSPANQFQFVYSTKQSNHFPK
jgi:hypothetical protein